MVSMDTSSSVAQHETRRRAVQVLAQFRVFYTPVDAARHGNSAALALMSVYN